MMQTKIVALYEQTTEKNDELIRRLKNNMECRAKVQGVTNVKHFTDNGYSVGDRNRPGFSAMMKQVQDGNVKMLITKSLSNLAESPEEQVKLSHLLQKCHVCLLALDDETRWVRKHREALQKRKMPERIRNPKNGLEYALHGNYYYPILLVPSDENQRRIGKWGLMHETYLREHHPGQYAYLLLSGQLPTVLANLDEQARERWNRIFSDLCESEGVNEALKARDQMAWIRRTQNIIARCDEIIEAELIFR